VILLRTLDNLPDELRHGAVTIGNFDGVHRGHAALVETLVAEAKAHGGPTVVFTLDPHPASVLRHERIPPSLSWTERKAELLGHLGVDAMIAYPTDRHLLGLDARTFFQQIVRDRLAARAMVEGPNFFFGRDRSGDLDVLAHLCRQAHMVLKVAPAVEFEGATISSSRIRRLVAEGAVEQANRMLTQPYRIRGLVEHGRQRGRRLGIPTANLGRIDTLVPGEGIYAARAWVGGAAWPAAVSVGPNPTFDESALKIEAFLLGYEGDLYDRRIELDFLARLRHIERFETADALVAQVDRDIREVQRIVAANQSEGKHDRR